jgi:hypothetical protein
MVKRVLKELQGADILLCSRDGVSVSEDGESVVPQLIQQ